MDCAKWFRMRRVIGVLILLLPAAIPADETCKLMKLADMPVSLEGRQPVITAKINGVDALFAVDSGAFWSTLSTAAARQYGLDLDRTGASGLYIQGIGGNVALSVATVKVFTIFDVPVKNMEFVVVNSDMGGGTAGLLGQNILRFADIEFDLAHGMIRFFRSDHCDHTDLAYWVKAGDGYSAMKIESATISSPHIAGEADLGGKKIRVIFDTGASTSILSTRAAKRAGITPDSPGATPAGEALGLGRKPLPTWTANFPSFKIGDEEIRHARLRFGNIETIADMLLGADFFLSHRVYVSSRMNRLYFTYNGGPVFDLRPRPSLPPSTGAATAASASDAPLPGDEPKDAAGFAQRASVLAAREQLDRALADWNRACELAPDDPSYVFQRARLHAQRSEWELALSDLERTLHLKPDQVEALAARAMLRIRAHDSDSAMQDLGSADQLAPKHADIRLWMAGLYIDADQPAAAIAQYSQWIDAHGDDARLSQAYNGRCWARGLSGRELDLALKDCNAALRLRPKSGDILDSRGLVYLRMGRLDKAIDDYNASLQQNPESAWSHYGRGIARLRQGLTSEGQADIEVASSAEPSVIEHARRLGIAP